MNNNRAIIVGSGPSAEKFVPPDNVDIIAVNGAIDWLTRADYFFTLDDSLVNMKRLTNQRSGVKYCAAFSPNIKTPNNVRRFNRIGLRIKEPAAKNNEFWWAWRWSAKLGLCESKDDISSGNSAYGAVNLAYHLDYKYVAVIGVDGTSEPRVDGTGRPNNLSHLPLLFYSASQQINLISLGKISSIPQMTLSNWLKYTSN
jgi:hypothetical protein